MEFASANPSVARSVSFVTGAVIHHASNDAIELS
jgi:hypothetical protein